MLGYALSYILHYNRKLVATDMRVGVYKDGRISSETHKLVEDFTYVTPL